MPEAVPEAAPEAACVDSMQAMALTCLTKDSALIALLQPADAMAPTVLVIVGPPHHPALGHHKQVPQGFLAKQVPQMAWLGSVKSKPLLPSQLAQEEMIDEEQRQALKGAPATQSVSSPLVSMTVAASQGEQACQLLPPAGNTAHRWTMSMAALVVAWVAAEFLLAAPAAVPRATDLEARCLVEAETRLVLGDPTSVGVLGAPPRAVTLSSTPPLLRMVVPQARGDLPNRLVWDCQMHHCCQLHHWQQR
mmetsp:Transcript_40894/g.76079  ORF Transcript_40894/g.76079 Transcript_40894/m.76079 type:complete len:249 (+) Transcript_40894:1209-1955(+)